MSSRAPKVLHLIESAGVYGAEVVVLGLAGEQRRQGLDACIGSMCPPGMRAAIEEAALNRGIPVERIEMRPGINPRAPHIVRHQIAASAPDVIHAHGYKANVLTALARPALKVPVVTTLHGWVSEGQVSRNSFYEWLDRRLLFRKDALVLVAKTLREDAFVRRHRSVTVIPNGVEPESATVRTTDPDLLPLIEFCRRAPTFIAVGRLSPEKNQAAAIQAIARLRGQGEIVQMLIVGEGPLRVELSALVHAVGLQDAVCLPGYVRDPSRLNVHVRGLVLTSLTEGAPIAILEAMRDRVPIISAAVGDVPELTGGQMGAWLVQANDSEAVSEAISNVMRDSAEPERRARFARERWESRYTLERMAQRYAKVYASVGPNAMVGDR